MIQKQIADAQRPQNENAKVAMASFQEREAEFRLNMMAEQEMAIRLANVKNTVDLYERYGSTSNELIKTYLEKVLNIKPEEKQ